MTSDQFVTMDDGARLHVLAEPPSKKPPLLFSNSLGTNLHMWDAQATAFADRFRIVRYDSRGHGRSDAPPGPYSIERLGRDAVQLLDGLGIERVNFCGLSKGGMVGQWLGVNAPERIVRLALCNTSSYMPPRETWEARIAAVTAGGMAAIADIVIERWFTKPFRDRAPQEVGRIRDMLLPTPPNGYCGCVAALRDMDQRETIKAIRVPTLVLAGALDPATPAEHGRLIHAAIAGSEFVLLPDVAHLSNVERTEAFNRVVREFL